MQKWRRWQQLYTTFLVEQGQIIEFHGLWSFNMNHPLFATARKNHANDRFRYEVSIQYEINCFNLIWVVHDLRSIHAKERSMMATGILLYINVWYFKDACQVELVTLFSPLFHLHFHHTPLTIVNFIICLLLLQLWKSQQAKLQRPNRPAKDPEPPSPASDAITKRCVVMGRIPTAHGVCPRASCAPTQAQEDPARHSLPMSTLSSTICPTWKLVYVALNLTLQTSAPWCTPSSALPPQTTAS